MHFIAPDGTYPAYYGHILNQVAGFKLGDPTPEGWTEVEDTNPPEVGEYEKPKLLEPIEVDGKMVQQWTVEPMTAEEVEAKDAPKRARQKLIDLGLTEAELEALFRF